MRIDILTLVPEMCERVLSESIIGRAQKAGKTDVVCHNIRDFAGNKHNKVDDMPYGGGMGMVMAANPIFECFESLYDRDTDEKPHLIYMSPKGKTLTQKRVTELAKLPRIAILCGPYEGIDERVIEEIVDEEISVGDYVLTGGELPALTLTDAVCRMLPGVLSDDLCFTDESHFAGVLEYPQYTRPVEWEGRKVPDILMSGHHKNIADWRLAKAEEVTQNNRPDLWQKYLAFKRG